MSKRKVKEYFFVLVNINTSQVEEKYNIVPNSISTLTTKIGDLQFLNSDNISYISDDKKNHICKVSMVDINTFNDTHVLKYNCFWCKHPFDHVGIGCPINYVFSKLTKQYTSEISKDVYTIKENITPKRKSNTVVNPNIKITNNDYYETDGLFCSFNCCKAYIKDNKHLTLYDRSEILLNKMYQDMFGKGKLDLAPHWRLLKEYGGHLTIQEFRNSFQTVEYEKHGIVRFEPIGRIYEEKFKF